MPYLQSGGQYGWVKPSKLHARRNHRTKHAQAHIRATRGAPTGPSVPLVPPASPQTAVRAKSPQTAASASPHAALGAPWRVHRRTCAKAATAKRRRRTCGRADMPDTRLPPPHVRPCTAHETIRAPPPLLPPLHAPSDGFGAPQRARGGATGAAAAPRARRPRWRRRRRMAAVMAAATAATVVVAAAAAAAATTTAAATAVALAEIVAVVVAAVAAPWALIK
eukprot:7391908-Prymnesium_polylepis.1